MAPQARPLLIFDGSPGECADTLRGRALFLPAHERATDAPLCIGGCRHGGDQLGPALLTGAGRLRGGASFRSHPAVARSRRIRDELAKLWRLRFGKLFAQRKVCPPGTKPDLGRHPLLNLGRASGGDGVVLCRVTAWLVPV
jgi:hypothetical protein